MIQLLLIYCLLSKVNAPGPCSGFACCKQKVSKPEYDSKGKAYGFENGASCIAQDNNVIKSEKVEKNNDQQGILPSKPTEKHALLPSDNSKKLTDIQNPKLLPTSISKLPQEAPPTLIKQKAEITLTATKYSPSKTTTTSTASKQIFVANGPAKNQLEGYLTVFPSLPSPVAYSPFLQEDCKVLNSVIQADVANCTQPFIQSVYNSYKQADRAAVDIIDCICTTSFKVGHQAVAAHVRLSCPPPGNMTKSGFFSIKDGCSIIPYNYGSIADSLNVFARIINGESYLPFSVSSGYNHKGLIAAFFSLFIFII